MEDVYEYRLAGRRRVVWLAAVVVVFLIATAVQYDAPQLLLFIWGLTAAMVAWMLLANPIAGMRLDDSTWTLSAFRNPRPIPLSEIDHVRVKHWTEDSDVYIVFRDGTEEEVPTGDLPSIPVLESLLIERGIPVRDPR